MTLQSLDVGRATSSQPDATLTPYVRVARPPCSYGHGAANGPSELLGQVLPTIRTLMGQITRDGFAVGAYNHPQLWNNTVDRARNSAMLAYLRTTWGASADPGPQVGGSMGACSALGFSQAFPAEVSCVVGFIPALDLDWLRDNNFSGARAVIDVAWGVTWPAPLPEGANPLTVEPTVPVQLWASSDDEFSTNVEAWADEHDLVEFHDLGALGHTNAAIQAVDVDAVREFIREHTP